MQQLPITVQSQRPRLAAVKPLTLGEPGDFLCPALVARGWAGRAPPGRRERITHIDSTVSVRALPGGIL